MVGAVDFGLEGIGACADVDDFDADVFAVAFFEVDVFNNDGIVGVAKDEQFWLLFHAGDLVGLAFFDEPSEFFAT